MSGPILPDGFFFTTINGRRCTAVPKAGAITTAQLAPDAPAPAPTQPPSPPPPDPPRAQLPDQQDPPPQERPPERGVPFREPPQAEQPQDQPPQAPLEPPPPPPPPLPPIEEVPASPTTTPPSSTRTPAPEPPPDNATIPFRTIIPLPQASQIQGPLVPPLQEPSAQLPPERETGTGAVASSINGADPTSTLIRPSVVSGSQLPAGETSQTDRNAVPTQINPGGPPSTTDGRGLLITTASSAPSSQPGEGAAGTSNSGAEIPGIPQGIQEKSADSSSSSSSSNGNTSGLSPAAIAGSVVGSVAFLTLLVVFLWFLRKHRSRSRRVGASADSGHGEGRRRQERPYVFDQESVGPTPKSARFKAALGYNYQRFRGQLGGFLGEDGYRAGATMLSRERSGSPVMSQHSRHNSAVSSGGDAQRDILTTKDRLKDWWDRLTADALFNWRLRNDTTLDPDPFASVREKQSETTEQRRTSNDFVSLLGMSEKGLGSEEQRQGANRRTGSSVSADHFLGGLGFNVNSGNANANPFADTNALPAEPARAADVNVNPFADSNEVPAASTSAMPGPYRVANARRSRASTIAGPGTRPPSTLPPVSPQYDSLYRESGGSMETFDTRRNRWRSDPFDLERPELLGPPFAREQRESGEPKRPWPTHARHQSSVSKYSSGIGSNCWIEPGPDVGSARPLVGSLSGPGSPPPAPHWRPAMRSDVPEKGEARRSINGDGSVGKAM
ncbi:hypothetical protein SODALDRAFT_326885 [Sodiomyces alkalinus F11]|uniref:Uncharacterized protein n=1 Tax=Sodiomyces alkalinus (strain CBS 110278 / VKM F-3762 / F11) TaxID=1314773 RepID=A0A3N2Q7J1_SODAK|nr:hypothetical protein SODALDRAFT_326885 [Sodiomyces alkalinus F11]ROT42730.1 hypothetical protein SODALDRAFT_326885 [Sodiomyces alkalinus F11]